MDRAEINVSGAEGSGSSVKIYETPDYEYPWRGAYVAHGAFTAGPGAPDNQRIEVVELNMPGIHMRVKADDVRSELQGLLAANKARREEDCHSAFDSLCSAMCSIAGKHITIKHLEAIAQSAFKAGVKRGEAQLRGQFRNLLGLGL